MSKNKALSNRIQNFTFMIDDTQSIYSQPMDPEKARQSNKPTTVY